MNGKGFDGDARSGSVAVGFVLSVVGNNDCERLKDGVVVEWVIDLGLWLDVNLGMLGLFNFSSTRLANAHI